jgi:hypothetical protein
MSDTAVQLDLIDDILNGDFNKAEDKMKAGLALKQNVLLDQEKIKLSGQVFNNAFQEEIPVEGDELTDEEVDDAIEPEAAE